MKFNISKPQKEEVLAIQKPLKSLTVEELAISFNLKKGEGEDITCSPFILGQDKALQNLKVLLENPLYPIVVVGEQGSGRFEAVTTLLKELQKPFLVEKTPSFGRLFGYKEGVIQHEGSLVKAKEGFLVLWLEDLLTDLNKTELWRQFKHCLTAGQVVQNGQPFPIDVKVILIAQPALFDYLYNQEESFRQLFKGLVELESEIERNNETTRLYHHFCGHLTEQNHLLPLDLEGLYAVLHYAVKKSGHHNYFTANKSLLNNLLEEAHFWAVKLGQDHITQKAVEQALTHQENRKGLTGELIYRDIKNKQLLINFSGRAVGKINGLAVLEQGDFCFGVPMLITAQATAGKDGLINIEKEVGLSGELHDKGVLILEGFLRSRFGRYNPLSVTVSLCFEQSYDGIDGDSATLAETCVIISSIAQIPLRQDRAITGSMNQFGEVQPVGGISEKVEGFFKLCQAEGLNGQGVIIPSRNLDNLFLNQALMTAMEEKKFFIWPISYVEEALALLTDMAVDQLGTLGHKTLYHKASLYGIVETELAKMGG